MKIITIMMMVAVAAVTMVQSKSMETFIIDGNDSHFIIGFYAYLEIFRQSDFGGSTMYFGGGTVISTSFILTVAQNVAGFKSWRIGLGGNRISNMQWFFSTTSFIHHGYNNQTLADNVALLRLTQLTSIGINITPIALRPDNISVREVKVYGFGFNTTNHQPDMLQIAQFNIIFQLDCQARYPHLAQTGQIVNHVCAERTAGNICAGDQGGPVVLGTTLFGIQSFYGDENCGSSESQPAAFIRVPMYVSWINNVTNTQPLL